jgi:hypothetical protein
MKNSTHGWRRQLKVVAKTYTGRWHFWTVVIVGLLTSIPMLASIDPPQMLDIEQPWEVYMIRPETPSTLYIGENATPLVDSSTVQIPDDVDSVSLNGPLVTDTTLNAIVKSSPQLTSLYLTNTAVTDRGLSELSGLPKLGILFVDGSVATGTGLKSFSKSKTLTSLSLTRSHLDAQGVSAIASLESLTSLDLTTCQLDERELFFLGRLRNLRSLRLQATRVSPISVGWISELKELRGINVGNSRFTADGVRQLRRMLPNLVEVRGVSSLYEEQPTTPTERQLLIWRVSQLAPLLISTLYLGSWLGVHLKQQFAAPRSLVMPGFAGAHLAVAAALIAAVCAVPTLIIWYRAGTSVVSLIGIQVGLLAAFAWMSIRNSLATLLGLGAFGAWVVLGASAATQHLLAAWFLSPATTLAAWLLLVASMTTLALIGRRLATMHEAMPEYGFVASFDLAFDLTSRSTNRTRQQLEARAVSKSVFNAWLLDRLTDFVMKWLPRPIRWRNALLMQLSHGFASLFAVPVLMLTLWLAGEFLPGFRDAGDERVEVSATFVIGFLPMMSLAIVNGQWLQHWRWFPSELLRPSSREQYVSGLLSAISFDGILIAGVPTLLILVAALRGWAIPGMSSSLSFAFCAILITAHTITGVSLLMWLTTCRRILPPVVGLSLSMGLFAGLAKFTMLLSGETLVWLLPVILLVAVIAGGLIARMASRRWNSIEFA